MYVPYGVSGKKWVLVGCGVIQGLLSVGLGVYVDGHANPSCKFDVRMSLDLGLFFSWLIDRYCIVAVVIVLFVLIAIVNEIANGVNFSLVPHCNPSSNGFMVRLSCGLFLTLMAH